MNWFLKNSGESFIIAGDISPQLLPGESINFSGSEVLAYDKDGADVSSVVLDQNSMYVDGDKLAIQCRAGVNESAPYKILFRICTTAATPNYWEIEVFMYIDFVPVETQPI